MPDNMSEPFIYENVGFSQIMDIMGLLVYGSNNALIMDFYFRRQNDEALFSYRGQTRTHLTIASK